MGRDFFQEQNLKGDVVVEKKDIAPILKEALKAFSIEILVKMKDYLFLSSCDESIQEMICDINAEILTKTGGANG